MIQYEPISNRTTETGSPRILPKLATSGLPMQDSSCLYLNEAMPSPLHHDELEAGLFASHSVPLSGLVKHRGSIDSLAAIHVQLLSDGFLQFCSLQLRQLAHGGLDNGPSDRREACVC